MEYLYDDYPDDLDKLERQYEALPDVKLKSPQGEIQVIIDTLETRYIIADLIEAGWVVVTE